MGCRRSRRVLDVGERCLRSSRRDGVARSAPTQLEQIYETQPRSARGAAAPRRRSSSTTAYRSLAQRYDDAQRWIRRRAQISGDDGARFSASILEAHRHAQTRSRWSSNSFRKMARGGIYDQIGGGFARYSVDASWLVPHFEKMLYDNALLARLGAHLWQATKDEEIRRVTIETVEWVAREMTSPEGGFYSSLDADSEGHEGKFYVWTDEEIDSLLGADAPRLQGVLRRDAGGNFEGKNILFVATRSGRGRRTRRRGRDNARRDARPRHGAFSTTRAPDASGRRATRRFSPPGTGLMLRGIATAARAFGRDDFRNTGSPKRRLPRSARWFATDV